MPSEENQAQYDSLKSKAAGIDSDIAALESAKAELQACLKGINKSYNSFSATKRSVLSKPLTAKIMVKGEFEGKCAEGLSRVYSRAKGLINSRETRISSLTKGTASQIAKIDNKIQGLKSQKSSITTQMGAL